MKMRKLVAVLVAVLMLCCIMPISAAAEGNSATIDFTDKANRTAYSTEQQVWEQNGIVIINDKGASTSNVGDYGGDGYPARFYKNSTVTIEYAGMTQIVINCNGLESKYVNGWADSVAGSNATASVDGSIVTIVFAEAVDSFTWEALTAQSRAYSISVYTNGATPDVPVEPDEPVEPDVPASDLVLIDAPVAGVAYKFGMIQGNVSSTDVYYLTGAMSSYYMATTTDAAAAIDVYLEETTGGYYLYAMISGVKTYINMVVSTTHVNGAYSDTASTVYTYDAEAKTVIGMAQPDGAEAPAAYWFGTRNDKTYTTVGPCAVEYAGFYCQFYGTATTPDVPVEPEVPTEGTLTIEQAIALGQTMEHNTYTEQAYYVTGVITEVYNTQYGNMYIADAAGNTLLLYGTYNADGSVRYDAMDVKPVAGDTITIYGYVGQFNGNSQIKNGWIVDHVAGETPDVPVEPDVPAEPEVEMEIAAELKEGVAYKLAMNQTEKGALYFFIGTMSTYYGATDTNVDLAVDMYVEIVEGGYNLYFNDANGDKQYIALVQSGTHYNFTFGAEASVFSWDAERNALYATAGDMVCYMGTYGSYVTVGTLKQDMLSDADYIARLYVEKAETPDEPVNPDEPGNDEPETPDEPVNPDSPPTGDNSTVYVTLAMILVALSAAALVVTKKRA